MILLLFRLLSSWNSSSLVTLFLSSTLAQRFIPMVITQTMFLATATAFPQCHSHASCPLISISSLSGQPQIGPFMSLPYFISSVLFLTQVNECSPPLPAPSWPLLFQLAWLNTTLVRSIFPSTRTLTYPMSVTGEKPSIDWSHFKFVTIDLNWILKLPGHRTVFPWSIHVSILLTDCLFLGDLSFQTSNNSSCLT